MTTRSLILVQAVFIALLISLVTPVARSQQQEQPTVVQRAILDKHVVIPDGDRVGVDLGLDRQRFVVTESNIVVVPKYEVGYRPAVAIDV